MIKKNKKKIKKVPMNDFLKTTIVVCLIIFVSIFVLFALSFLYPIISYYVWNCFVAKINSVLFYIFSKGILGTIAFILPLLCCMIISIIHDNILFKSKISNVKKFVVLNRLRSVMIMVYTIFFSFIILVSFSTTMPLISDLYMAKNSKKEYKISDLEALRDIYYDKINEYSNKFERDDNGDIIYDKPILDLSIVNLKKLSNKMNIISGIYPRGYRYMGELDIMNDGTYLGLTNPMFHTISIAKDLPTTKKLLVITHEFCHSKGLLREADAEFCSTIALLESDDELSNYTAYLNIFNYVNSALIDMEHRNSEYNKNVVDKCLKDGYMEFCNYTASNIYNLIKRNDNIYIETYYLKNYEEKINDLKINLFHLNNNYDVNIYLNEDEISFEKINSYLEDGIFSDKDYITVKILTKKEDILKLYEYLRKNSKIFEYEYAEIDDEEDEIESYEEYYLSPFKKPGLNSIIGNDDFDYDRVVRLLLEYNDM